MAVLEFISPVLKARLGLSRRQEGRMVCSPLMGSWLISAPPSAVGSRRALVFFLRNFVRSYEMLINHWCWRCPRCEEIYPLTLCLDPEGPLPELGPLAHIKCARCGLNPVSLSDELIVRELKLLTRE